MTVSAYVDENAVGNHDIVFGRRFCSEFGLILDYKTRKFMWNDMSVPMQNKSTNHTISDDPGDEDQPYFMKKSTHYLAKGLSPNWYNKHDYKKMVR